MVSGKKKEESSNPALRGSGGETAGADEKGCLSTTNKLKNHPITLRKDSAAFKVLWSANFSFHSSARREVDV